MTSDEFREKLRNFLISLNDEINWDIINYQEEDDGAIATISIWEFEDEDHERESYSPNDYSDDQDSALTKTMVEEMNAYESPGN